MFPIIAAILFPSLSLSVWIRERKEFVWGLAVVWDQFAVCICRPVNSKRLNPSCTHCLLIVYLQWPSTESRRRATAFTCQHALHTNTRSQVYIPVPQVKNEMKRQVDSATFLPFPRLNQNAVVHLLTNITVVTYAYFSCEEGSVTVV